MNETTEPTTLTAALAHHAAHRPDHEAIICAGRTLTYGELSRASDRTAQGLRAAGAGRGSRVAYLGKETEHYYELIFACAKIGAVVVPVNWWLTTGEVDHILRDSDTRLLFAGEEFLEAADRLRTSLPKLRNVIALDGPGGLGDGFRDWRDGHTEVASGFEPTTDEPVAQMYTSGTTGPPKGVVLAHRSFFNYAGPVRRAGLDWIDWLPGDVSLVGIPGFHIGGLAWALQNFNAGVTNVAMPMFGGQEAVRLIRELGLTTAFVAPAMLRLMLAEAGVSEADFRSLRKVVYGGSPIDEPLLERALKIMGCSFVQIYGSTETGNCAVNLPAEDHVPGGPRMRAAGKPYPGVELEIVDGAGRPVAPGGVGEVCVRTPARMLEYWGRPDDTARTLVDGWIRTGDAGYLDEDGYLFLCDRISDTIIVAGENVYPAEVENELSAHPGVAEVAVVGAPDDRWGEAVRACVVPRPDAQITPRELMLFLRGRVADFKIPTGYEFVESLPRNPSGKILRRRIREEYWRDRERKIG